MDVLMAWPQRTRLQSFHELVFVGECVAEDGQLNAFRLDVFPRGEGSD
jgi:hypothetical protein